MPISYDVVIIGAGPAGLTAAETILTNSKMSVLVIDKYGLDYNKPCGGGLPRDCIEEFPFLIPTIKHKTTKIMAKYKHTEKKYPMEISMTPRSEMREQMITRLLDKNTILDFGILFNVIVNKVNLHEHTLNILPSNQTVHYKWLIGGDGVNSIVAKTIGFKYKKAPVIVTHNKSTDSSIKPKDDIALIEFLDGLPGYFWVFPKGDHVNIGLGGDIQGRELKQWFDEILQHLDGYVDTTYRSAHLMPFQYNSKDPPHDKEHNIILCGDAASFVNCITGEGIYFAMKSGKEAAEIILGEREFIDYPSFKKYLERVQSIKNDLNGLTIKDSYHRIFGDDDISKDTVKFLFSHSIPDLKPLTEEEKQKMYDNM